VSANLYLNYIRFCKVCQVAMRYPVDICKKLGHNTIISIWG